MQMVVVVGSSGSGKTNLAKRLATSLDIAVLELDSLFHQEGWNSLPDPEFQSRVAEFVNKDRWIIDGNYTSHGMKQVVWPYADTVIWLDLPKPTIMKQVVGRTFRRALTREELWNGVHEPLTNFYRWDPEKNIIRWAWTRFDHTRAKYEEFATDGTWKRLTIHRLRKRSEVDEFLARVAAERSQTHG